MYLCMYRFSTLIICLSCAVTDRCTLELFSRGGGYAQVLCTKGTVHKSHCSIEPEKAYGFVSGSNGTFVHV